MQPFLITFIISKNVSAYLVAVNDREVIIEPHYDEVRRLATIPQAFVLQNLSRYMVKLYSPPDPCHFLLESYARAGWTIEEADIEAFMPVS